VSRGLLLAAGAIALLAAAAWKAELFTVSRPGERPRPLVATPASERASVTLDVALPAVPVGMVRLRDDEGPLLIHYWAPWQRDALDQVTQLDSLRRLEGLENTRVVVVCFDPFPSVARYVGRHRLRLSVLLDGEHRMRRALPCPSVPFTYVVDGAGRVAVAQPGEVAWLAPTTLATLREIAARRDTLSPRAASAAS
jgi:hypothetical protein